MNTNIIDQVQKIHQNKTSSAACIASAIMQDNSMLTSMTAYEFKLLCSITARIETMMRMNDEARFTLYDYLDALLNPSPRQPRWTVIAEEIEAGQYKFDDLVSLAERKRQTYES